MKTIDLRSDTVTLPSPEMKTAMLEAELGDDVYGEDPSVNALEKEAAALTGKEAALFVASGTMGNLLASLVHCRRGEQILLAAGSHIFHWEQGGASALGGIAMKALAVDEKAEMNRDDLGAAINGDDPHLSRTKLICLENTYNGQALSNEYMAAVRAIATGQKANPQATIKLHLDGARLFNAALALGCSAGEIASHFDSVQFCCSKGLGAPVGSLLCGDSAFIAEARRARKVVGGGMRQAGMLAAACRFSLQNMVARLADDHANALNLARGLAAIETLEVLPAAKRTNMVFFRAAGTGAGAGITQVELAAKLKEKNILVSNVPGTGLRAVTHYGIEESDIEAVIERIKGALT